MPIAIIVAKASAALCALVSYFFFFLFSFFFFFSFYICDLRMEIGFFESEIYIYISAKLSQMRNDIREVKK